MLAKCFNKKLDKMGGCLKSIKFLDCWFYVWNSDKEAILCEPCLDKERYKKFNDNRGGVYNVNGRVDDVDIDIEHIDDRFDEEEREEEKHSEDGVVIDDDIPQAFSHW